MIAATSEWWAQVEQTGEGVLFRASDIVKHPTPDYPYHEFGPPAEFVEWANPCETCDPKNWTGDPAIIEHLHQHGVLREASIAETGLPCCIDGKRRIAAVVEHLCFHEGQRLLRKDVCDCGTDDGLVTVGHVIVTWGPARVQPISDTPEIPCVQITDDGEAFFLPDIDGADSLIEVLPHISTITLPPDIDPATLVGQWALGVKKVEP